MRARDGDADHDSSAMNQSIRRAFGKCPTRSPPDWTAGRHDRDALVQRGSRAGEIEQFRRDERMAQPMQHLPRAGVGRRSEEAARVQLAQAGEDLPPDEVLHLLWQAHEAQRVALRQRVTGERQAE